MVADFQVYRTVFQRSKGSLLGTVLISLLCGQATLAGLVAELRPTYVGADTSMSTAPPTTAGTPVMGINHDGVGFLNSNCTASLLWTGQHVLTAAHCVNSLAAGSIRFDLSSGPLTYTYGAGDAQRHPSYSGMVENGYDVAVIKLGTVVDVTVPRYDIFTLTDQSEIGVTSVKFGYGLTGNGNTGSEGSRGTKHYGVNEWESLGLGDLRVPGTTNDSTQLTYDFDNGLAANDGFGYFFGSGAGAAGNPIYDDTGLGLDETMSAGGDSGSPTFVLDGGTYKIAGVGSYISRLADSGGNSSDIDLLNNSTFGEFAGDARVATMAAFITTAVPEPGSILLVGFSGFAAGLLAAIGWLRARFVSTPQLSGHIK